MRLIQKLLTALVAGVLIVGMVGCSGSKQSSEPSETDLDKQSVALDHFIQGSLLDQKGEYAKAILEYQDALTYTKDPAVYHSIAKDYSIIGKHELAIKNGREAVRLDPDNRTYHETLAEIYLHAANIGVANLDSAISQYQEVVRIDSSYQDGWMNLVRFQQLRDPQRALATYQQIIDRFGPDEGVYLQMAHIYSDLKEFDKATDAMKSMHELDPNNAEIKKSLGDLYLQQDSVDAALKIFNDLVAADPENVELRAALAHTYLVKQDYQHATEQFEAVMHRDSVSADEQIGFGRVFLSFIQKDSAVVPYAEKLFQQIQQAHPDDWRPYWFLGAIDNITKDDSSALLHFQKVTQLAKWNPDGWIGVASVYYDRERFDDAIETLNEAKQYVPDEFRVYFLLGVAYQRKHENIDAASSLEKALQLNDKSVDAMSALAMTYDDMKRTDESDSLYERALRLDPQNHLILNNYSYSLAERGLQLDRALQMAKEAVNQQPDNQSYLDTYGWVYYKLGNYEEAAKWIQKAIDLGSTSAVVNEHLGDIYFKMSDKGRAMLYWQKALQLDSSNQSLREKIERGRM
jgi:tetratricopeptide (TPR) repeat protein